MCIGDICIDRTELGKQMLAWIWNLLFDIIKQIEYNNQNQSNSTIINQNQSISIKILQNQSKSIKINHQASKVETLILCVRLYKHPPRSYHVKLNWSWLKTLSWQQILLKVVRFCTIAACDKYQVIVMRGQLCSFTMFSARLVELGIFSAVISQGLREPHKRKLCTCSQLTVGTN